MSRETVVRHGFFGSEADVDAPCPLGPRGPGPSRSARGSSGHE